MTRVGLRLVVTVAAAFALIAATPPPPGSDAARWWQPVGFAGHNVSRIAVAAGEVHVDADGQELASADRGVTWHASAFPIPPPPPPGTWIGGPGRPALVTTTGLRVDAAGPALGGSTLVTAPAAMPGVVVAVDAASVVWHRDPQGDWGRALLLLPDGLGAPPPRVTAVASFSAQPLSPAVYVGTDGYGVLESGDGGQDWVRFDPGLPGHITGLGADDGRADVYAATTTGLFVHHLQTSPSPPDYHDSSYWWRVAAMAVVASLSSLAALGLLRRFSRPPSVA